MRVTLSHEYMKKYDKYGYNSFRPIALLVAVQ